jgi:hypothetical protein
VLPVGDALTRVIETCRGTTPGRGRRQRHTKRRDCDGADRPRPRNRRRDRVHSIHEHGRSGRSSAGHATGARTGTDARDRSSPARTGPHPPGPVPGGWGRDRSPALPFSRYCSQDRRRYARRPGGAHPTSGRAGTAVPPPVPGPRASGPDRSRPSPRTGARRSAADRGPSVCPDRDRTGQTAGPVSTGCGTGRHWIPTRSDFGHPSGPARRAAEIGCFRPKSPGPCAHRERLDQLGTQQPTQLAR